MQTFLIQIQLIQLIQISWNKCHLKLKESLLILKLKPSLNLAKQSMALHLFENDS